VGWIQGGLVRQPTDEGTQPLAFPHLSKAGNREQKKQDIPSVFYSTATCSLFPVPCHLFLIPLLSVGQHGPNSTSIRRGNDDGLAQSPLALPGLRSQDVARKGVPALQLAGGRDFEALLCSLVGLQLQLDLLGLCQLYSPDSPLVGSGVGGPAAAAMGIGVGLG